MEKTLSIHYKEQKNKYNVFYHKNIVYDTIDGHDIHLEVLLPEPKKAGETFKCLAYVQGSGWAKQTFMIERICELSKIAERGYVVVDIEYRGTDIAPIPAQIQDARTAIRFLRKNAALFKIDPKGIFIGGSSSGGHTALMMEMTRGIKTFDNGHLKEISDEVRGVFDKYGPTDMAVLINDLSKTSGIEEGLRIIGDEKKLRNKKYLDSISPFMYLGKRKHPPYLIIHGTSDTLVNPLHSKKLYDTLINNGDKADLYFYEGLNHGGPDYYADKSIDVITKFLKEN